jgi:hypothetical protein
MTDAALENSLLTARRLAMLLAPVPAALTMHLGHALRTIEVVPFLAPVAALGAMELLQVLGDRRWIVVGLTAALALEMGIFLEDYFSAYPSRQAVWFYPGLEAAIAAARITPHRGPIQISYRIDNGVLMYAFFTSEDPKIYRAHQLTGGEAQLVAIAKTELPPGATVISKPDERMANAELTETITFPNQDGWGNTRMEPVYKIWRTR